MTTKGTDRFGDLPPAASTEPRSGDGGRRLRPQVISSATCRSQDVWRFSVSVPFEDRSLSRDDGTAGGLLDRVRRSLRSSGPLDEVSMSRATATGS